MNEAAEQTFRIFQKGNSSRDDVAVKCCRTRIYRATTSFSHCNKSPPRRVTTCSAICPVVVFASPAPRIHVIGGQKYCISTLKIDNLRDITETYWNILKHQAGKFTPFTVHLQTCKIQSYVYKLRTQSFQIVVLSLAWNLNEHLIARTSCTVGWNWCWLLRIAGNPKLITVA